MGRLSHFTFFCPPHQSKRRVKRLSDHLGWNPIARQPPPPSFSRGKDLANHFMALW